MISMKTWRIAAWLLAAGVCLAGGARALDGIGADQEFYVNTYSSIGTVKANDTRSRAMGGSGRGLADGVGSISVNPGALGAYDGKGVDVGLGYDSLADGDSGANNFTFKVGGAVSLEQLRPTGKFNQAIGGVFQTEGFSGAGGVGMDKNQTSITGAYGLHLTDDLLVGASVGLYDGKISSDLMPGYTINLDRKSTGGEFKVGALYRLSDHTTIGGTGSYSMGTYKERAAYAYGAGSGDLSRWSLGGGIAHQLGEDTLLLGDIWYDHLKTEIPGVVNERNNSWGLSGGVEQQVIEDLLALRGGLYYKRNSYSASGPVTIIGNDFGKGRFGFTAGAGLKMYSFELGYSLDVNTAGSVANMLDFSADW